MNRRSQPGRAASLAFVTTLIDAVNDAADGRIFRLSRDPGSIMAEWLSGLRVSRHTLLFSHRRISHCRAVTSISDALPS